MYKRRNNFRRAEHRISARLGSTYSQSTRSRAEDLCHADLHRVQLNAGSRRGGKLAAMERFESYAHKIEIGMPIFKQIGMQMVLFAKEEPRLYQLIFMSQNSFSSFEDIYTHLGEVADECLNTIMKDYGLSADDAKALFEHSWIHTYGIATLCATGMCELAREDISRMLTQDFTAMMMLLSSGNRDKA